jgi:flagellin FlaB
VKKKMKIRQSLRKLLKQNRGMVGIEAAIVLIAFVIVAAAFSFMVVNMGLFATQKGKQTIQLGVSQSSSPLIIDGDIMIRGTAVPFKVDAVVVPLESVGVNYVPMDQNATEVTVRVGSHTSIADCYTGVAPALSNGTGNPLNATLSELVLQVTNSQPTGTTATLSRLFIGNSNNNTSLDYNEKGYLVVYLNTPDQALPMEHFYLQIRPETGAPIALDFVVPPQLTQGWSTVGN